eukprot:SM000044S15927  [mRNA]  locus=s44:22082:24006:- [translate_table: standard]
MQGAARLLASATTASGSHKKAPEHSPPAGASTEAKPGAALPPRSPAAQVEAVLRLLLGGNAKIGDVSGTISSRVHDKVLLLDSVVAEGGAATRARRREIREQGRRSRHRMSMRQHRRQGSFDIKPPLNRHEYELYMPLHNLWAAYMRRLIENCRGVLLQQRIYGADLHGANISVVRAKDPSLVGVSGIVVKDMQQSFHIVARDDTVKVVPRDGAVFCLSVDSLKVRLYGGQLSFIGRPAERAATVEL